MIERGVVTNAMKALRNLYTAKNPHIRTFSLSQNVTSISHNGRFHAKYESVKVELLSSFFLNMEISSLRTTGARESALSWFNLPYYISHPPSANKQSYEMKANSHS